MAGNLDLSIRINADGTAAITGLRRVDDALNDLNQGAQRTSREVSGLGDALKGMVAAAAGFIAIDSMISGFTDANVEAGRLRASLETVTGSVRGASDAWDAMTAFAKQTPYDLAQATEGFVKLKALGLDASVESMRSYGNTASAMGKTMSDMIEAVADASTGEFERLKEFGIKARVDGEQVALTFQGMTTRIGNNAEDIEAYLMRIGEVEFGGAMERQMDTLGGAISNVRDAILGAWIRLGDSGLVSAVVDGLKWIAEWIENITQSMAAGDFDAWVDGLQGVAGAATGATGVYLALSAAVEAATIAQTAFNLVVSANPYVRAAIAVGALVGALYALRDVEFEIGIAAYALRDGFQAVWEEAAALATAAADAVAEGWFHTLSSVTAWFDAMGVDIGAVAVGIGKTFAELWDVLTGEIKAAINGWINLFIGFGKTVGTIAAALVTAFSRAFDDIAAIAGAAMFDLGSFDLDFTATKTAIADAFRAQVENGHLAGEQIGANFDLTVDHIDNVTSAAIAGVERIGERAKDISLTRQLDAASAEADALKESTVRATGAARDHAVATGAQAGATDKLTKAQRESNAELEEYAQRAGKVLAEQNRHGNLADQAAQARRYAASIEELLPVIDRMGQKYGVSREMILSLMETESRFVKNAKSPAGAMGLMQLMPATATEWAAKLGLVGNAWKTNVNDNIEIGVAYFAWLVQQMGDVNKAIQAYNGGIGNIQKGIVPEETRKYLPQVVGNVQALATVAGKAGDAIRDDLNRPLAEQAQIASEASQIIAQLNATWDSLADRYGTAYSAGRRQEEQLREIAILFKTGRMTADEYNAALADIRREYQAAQGPMGEYLAGLEEGMGTLETLAVDAMEGFNNAIVDGLVDGRFEFDDFVDDIKRTLAKMAVDTIVLKFAGQILGVSGLTGAAGTALAGSGAGAGTVDLSAGSLASLGQMFTGSSIGTGVASLLDRGYLTFGGSANGLAANTGWNSFTGGIAGAPNYAYGIGGIAGSYIGSQMFDGKYVGIGSSVGSAAGSALGAGAAGMMTSAGIGASYGSVVPVVGTIIGGILGGIVGAYGGSLFGDSTPRQGHFSTGFSGRGFEDNASATGAFGLKFGLADKGTANVKASEFQGAFDGMAQVSQMLAEFYGADLSAKIQASLVANVPDLNQWGKDLNGAFDAIFSGILWHADVVEGATGDGLGHLLQVAVGDLYGTADEMTAQLQSGMAVVRTVTALYGTEIGRLAGMADGDEFGSLEASINAMKAYASSFARGGETVAMTTERLIVGIASYSQALAMTGVQLDAVTKSGFDFVWMAQRFPDALAYFGFTLDSLMQTQSAYYDHFWTEEEKAIKQRDASLAAINAWSESIGQAGDAAIDTSAEFRDYIESLDLLDLAQQDAYLRAMQLVPAFVAMDEALATLEGAAGDAGDAVEDLTDTLAEFVASLKPESLTNNESLAQMVALFGEWGLQMPASSDALYALIQAGALTEAQMQALADRSETLGEALAGLAARQSAALALLKTSYDNAVSGATAASNARLDALRAGSTANEDALRAAYDLAVDAANADNSLNTETLQTQLDDLSGNFSDFERVVDAATDALRSLAEQGDGIDETRQRYLQEAQDAIAQFQSTGAFPDTVTDTLGGLGSVDPNDFATRDDWQAAIAENEAVVTTLRNLGAVQQSDAEIQIDLLEDRIEQAQQDHDDLLKRLSANLDADLRAERANLDRLIRAEEAALHAELTDLSDRFADAQAAIMADTNLILNTGNGLLQQILDSLQASGSPSGFDESYYLTQNPDVNAAVDAGTFSSGLDHYLNYGADEGRAGNLGTAAQFNELSYLQNNPDVAAAVASGMFESGWQHYLLHGIGEKRLPSYATGGLHPGGWRRVGEDGPELEFTGPSAILPSQMTRQLLSGDSGTKEEVSALRQEVRSLNATIASLLKIHRRWDGEGLPPDKMDYAKTIAEATP